MIRFTTRIETIKMPSQFIPVVAAIIHNTHGKILLAQRPAHLDHGGLWEFPGGKIEPGETAEMALNRELHEELGISVHQARPCIRVRYTYSQLQKSILLDTWQVETWQGQPYGREGQRVQWYDRELLSQIPLLAANYPIITALQLPERYLITPEPAHARDPSFFYHLERCLDCGITLVQLRAKNLTERDYCYCVEKALTVSERYPAQLLVNARPDIALSVGAAGVHLTSTQLMACTQRPLSENLWVAASCHTETEIHQANALNSDFIVLSPVRITASHPDAKPLGWQRFFQLTEMAHCPTFALGGMTVADIPRAWAHGAQGIAAIRALWDLSSACN